MSPGDVSHRALQTEENRGVLALLFVFLSVTGAAIQLSLPRSSEGCTLSLTRQAWMEAGTIAASMLAIFFFQTLIFIIVLAPRPEKIHRMIVQSAFIKILGSQSRHEAHHEAV